MQTGEIVPTIKIKPSHASQGEFVEINAEDFDPAVHKPLSADEAAQALCDASAVRKEHVDASVAESVAEAVRPARKAARKPKGK